MRRIIGDSLWAHLFLFYLVINMNLKLAIASPFLFVLFGVLYFMIIIKAAMNIADFEMSAGGEVLKHMDEHRGKIDSVIINRRK